MTTYMLERTPPLRSQIATGHALGTKRNHTQERVAAVCEAYFAIGPFRTFARLGPAASLLNQTSPS